MAPQTRLTDQRYADIQKSELAWWQHNRINVELLWDRHVEGFSGHLPARKQTAMADVGSGPIPFFCDEHIEAEKYVAIDPLFNRYVDIEYYQRFMDGYTIAWASKIDDVLSAQFDSVFALNMLDHCQSPNEMAVHLQRILKPGGQLYLFVDIDKDPDHMHPHRISEQWLRSSLSPLEMVMLKIEKSWKFNNMVMWYVGRKP